MRGKIALSLMLAMSYTCILAGGKTVAETYPGMAALILMDARIAVLPVGVVATFNGGKVTEKDLREQIEQAPLQLQEELKSNELYLAEQQLARKILILLGRKIKPMGDERDCIRAALSAAQKEIAISEAEMKEFYQRNRNAFPEDFDSEKAQVEAMIREEKKDRARQVYIASLSGKYRIQVAALWLERSIALARKNPIDDVRRNGLPTLAAFSAASCCGPDVVKPLLDSLKSHYAKRANFVYVDARKHQILGMRFQVESIPSFILFDDKGEVKARKTGRMTLDELCEFIGLPKPGAPAKE